MSLLAVMTRLLLRAGPTSVALVDHGVDVSSPLSIDTWESRTVGALETLSASVTFGPFEKPIEFDAVVLTIDGERELTPLGDRVRLPTGMLFDHALTIRVGRA